MRHTVPLPQQIPPSYFVCVCVYRSTVLVTVSFFAVIFRFVFASFLHSSFAFYSCLCFAPFPAKKLVVYRQKNENKNKEHEKNDEVSKIMRKVSEWRKRKKHTHYTVHTVRETPNKFLNASKQTNTKNESNNNMKMEKYKAPRESAGDSESKKYNPKHTHTRNIHFWMLSSSFTSVKASELTCHAHTHTRIKLMFECGATRVFVDAQRNERK